MISRRQFKESEFTGSSHWVNWAEEKHGIFMFNAIGIGDEFYHSIDFQVDKIP
jgi:hypothetical protein